MSLSVLLLIAQIVISLLLTGAILLQQRGTGIGGAFGGGNLLYASRRGIERLLFWSTAVLAFLFLAAAFLNLLI
ncbi:MAG: preprotein translocase subunit SecG [Candidatus Sungbacteria bacterium]|nr:preprotein translocase subunit SecG [Candidatus Sungbacteria bacterium]